MIATQAHSNARREAILSAQQDNAPQGPPVITFDPEAYDTAMRIFSDLASRELTVAVNGEECVIVGVRWDEYAIIVRDRDSGGGPTGVPCIIDYSDIRTFHIL